MGKRKYFRPIDFQFGNGIFAINMKLFLTSKIWKEGKHYVAYNPELEVASQGKTLEIAEKMLKEAVSLFIKTAKKIGTFNKILEEAGFVKKEKRWLAPTVSFSSLEMKV